MQDDELERIKRRKMEEMMKKFLSDEGKKVYSFMDPVNLNSENFDDFISKNSIAVVDFWAEWCGPCRMIAPIINELSRKYAGKVAFGKLNVDENPEIAARFNIMSIPTLLFFKNGRLVDIIVGAVPKSYIEARLSNLL